MIDTARLIFTLLVISIVFIVIGLATSKWPVGLLFNSRESWVIAVYVLLIIGVALLSVALIFEIINCCNSSVTTNATINQVRFVLVLLGVACLAVALIVFNAKYEYLWSYFISVVGFTIAMQVSILLLMNCSCIVVTSGTTTHRTVVTRTG